MIDASTFGALFGVDNSAVYSSNFQLFTESGTWVCPSANTEVFIVAIGGGESGGTNSDANKTAGGNTTVGAILTALGGNTSTNKGYSNGQIGGPVTPGSAATALLGGLGGQGVLNFGQGGFGAAYNNTNTLTGSGGNSGEIKTLRSTVSADLVITIGGGGAAGVGATKGSDGAVLIWWKEKHQVAVGSRGSFFNESLIYPDDILSVTDYPTLYRCDAARTKDYGIKLAIPDGSIALADSILSFSSEANLGVNAITLTNCGGTPPALTTPFNIMFASVIYSEVLAKYLVKMAFRDDANNSYVVRLVSLDPAVSGGNPTVVSQTASVSYDGAGFDKIPTHLIASDGTRFLVGIKANGATSITQPTDLVYPNVVYDSLLGYMDHNWGLGSDFVSKPLVDSGFPPINSRLGKPIYITATDIFYLQRSEYDGIVVDYGSDKYSILELSKQAKTSTTPSFTVKRFVVPLSANRLDFIYGKFGNDLVIMDRYFKTHVYQGAFS